MNLVVLVAELEAHLNHVRNVELTLLEKANVEYYVPGFSRKEQLLLLRSSTEAYLREFVEAGKLLQEEEVWVNDYLDSLMDE